MSFGTVPARDALDDKANRVFAGKVVRKDLVRKVKVGANVPVFVLEYLLGKYAASSDEVAIQMGLQVVNDTLANNYIRADESTKAQVKVKERGTYTFIDKVKVRLVDSDYWAEAVNFGDRFLHIPTHYVTEFERLTTGGIWAQLDMRFEYDEETKGKHPFWIDRLTPIQIATFDLEEYRRIRHEFTADEWLDLIVRSMGYEPAEMSRRLKLLFVLRLVPLAERNFNLVELGPRGTGKSYVVQEVSPYAALLTGGTTQASLFGHMNGKQKGMVQIWDVVGFDEVADLQKMPKEVVTTMKTYCESGTFQRGQEPVSGDASIAMFGNTNQPIDVMVQTGHLFAPMPDVIRDDMAFIDRLHFYLPGWEIPKMQNEHVYGPLWLRRRLPRRGAARTAQAQLHGAHRPRVRSWTASQRPRPQGSPQDRLGPYQSPLPGRRAQWRRARRNPRARARGSSSSERAAQEDGVVRVLPNVIQLHGPGERRRAFRRGARARGRDLISSDPLAPGTVYTSGVTSDGTVGLFRLEVSVATGPGSSSSPAGCRAR